MTPEKPRERCPYCMNDAPYRVECNFCNRTGWIPKWTYKEMERLNYYGVMVDDGKSMIDIAPTID